MVGNYFVNNRNMKKSVTIDSAKSYVESLVGRDVNVKVNRGRNRIKRYQGVVSEAHDNVFVVRPPKTATTRTHRHRTTPVQLSPCSTEN